MNYPSQGGQYGGEGSQGPRGVEYEGVDGQVHTYYPVAGRGQERLALGQGASEDRLPSYSWQLQAR